MANLKFRALCGTILLIALLLRLGAVVAVRPWSNHYERSYLYADARIYHELALSVQKEGISERFRNKVAVFAPGYPVLLGIVYTLFGANLILPILINVFFSVLTCLVLMLVVRIAFDDRSAIVAGLLFAFHPHSIRFTTILYSETLFMLLVSIFILGLLYIPQPDRRWILGFVITSVAASLGAFVRISMLYFSVLAVLFWLISHKTSWRFVAQRFSLFLLLYLICLSPWMIHNKIYHDTFRLSISGEYNLLALVVASAKADNIDEFHRIKIELVGNAYSRAKQDNVKNVFDTSRYFLEISIEEISKEPIRFILSQLKGIFNFWFRPVQAKSTRVAGLIEGDRKIVYYIYYSYVYQLLLLMAWGALFLTKGQISTAWKVLSVAAVIYFALTVGNAAYSRFFLQALPFIVPIAAVNIVGFFEWISRLMTAKINRQSN